MEPLCIILDTIFPYWNCSGETANPEPDFGGWGVTHLIEHLPSICEALDSMFDLQQQVGGEMGGPWTLLSESTMDHEVHCVRMVYKALQIIRIREIPTFLFCVCC